MACFAVVNHAVVLERFLGRESALTVRQLELVEWRIADLRLAIRAEAEHWGLPERVIAAHLLEDLLAARRARRELSTQSAGAPMAARKAMYSK